MTVFTLRQKQIMDASMQLVAEGGIQEFTIRNLSRRIGISEPAIYRHFDSKTDILLGILTYFEQNSRTLLEQAIASDKTGIEKAEWIFLAHLRQFVEHPAVSTVIFAEEIFQNDRRVAEKVLAIMNTNQAYLLNIIAQGVSEKGIRDDLPADHLVLVIMASLRLVITRWRLSKFGFDLEKEGTCLWASLQKLLQVPPSYP